jgi:hypothetical protein
MDCVEMFCGNCGATDQNDSYCSNCGQLTRSSTKPVKSTMSETKFGSQPSATPGFVLSLVGLLFVSVPLFCLTLSIIGIVMSRRVKNSLVEGQQGFKLANAGFVIGIVAVCITSLFMLLAIPGAWQHNFG